MARRKGRKGRKMKGGCGKIKVYSARHPRGIKGVRRKSCLRK